MQQNMKLSSLFSSQDLLINFTWFFISDLNERLTVELIVSLVISDTLDLKEEK